MGAAFLSRAAPRFYFALYSFASGKAHLKRAACTRTKKLMARKTRKNTRARPASKRKRSGYAQGASRSGTPLRWYWRYSLAVVLTGAAAMAWMSLLSYSPADPPTRVAAAPVEGVRRPQTRPTTAASQPTTASAPTTRPDGRPTGLGRSGAVAAQSVESGGGVSNAAGIVGAYTAHTLLWYLGSGCYAGLAFVTIGALVLGVRGRIPALPLRIAGVFLLMAATASGAFLLESGGAVDSPIGSPGMVGSAMGAFLLSRFARSGGWIIVAVAVAVGTIMTAGRLIFVPPRIARRAWLAAREATRKPSETGAGPGEAVSGPAGASARLTADRRSVIEEITRHFRDRAQSADRTVVRAGAPWLSTGPGYDEPFELPSVDLLSASPAEDNEDEQTEALRRRDAIQRTLSEFGVDAEVVAHQVGPVVTLFELSLAAGVKVSRVTGLSEDIARALAAPAVRVVSPLPGRDTIGIEMPNLHQQIVRVREMMDLIASGREAIALPVCLGKDAGGEPIVSDLAAMPHLLIAGTTGSGKSVCLNAILLSLLVTRRPAEVRLVLVDPKMVEMAAYDGIPHLLCPPVSDMRQAARILNWAAAEMDNRYTLLRDAGVRHIAEFNELDEEHRRRLLGIEMRHPDGSPPVPTRLPYYVIVVDELADLIMTSSKEVEGHIIRIAQKARAVGIHLVLATQRPSVKVVTGLIKANMPCRISFRVASRIESRIILDQNGAESLVGKGDMLLLRQGASVPVRAQGAFAETAEIRGVVEDLRGRSRPSYHPDLMSAGQSDSPAEATSRPDELLPQAVEVVLSAGRGSASLLRRSLSVSHAGSRALIDEMTELGVLGPSRGPRARECRITLAEWREIQAAVWRRNSTGLL